MNKLIRRICTLLVALIIALLSLFNAIVSIKNFFETDSYIFITNDYSNYGSARSIFLIAAFFFTTVVFYILYMICRYRGMLYDRLFHSYKVIGIMNIFNIVPDFVYVILKRNGKYYFQEDNYENTGKAGTLKKVERVKNNIHYKIRPLSDFELNNDKFNKLIVGDKAIEAFQYEENKLIIGTRVEIREFLNNYQTNDKILKVQILQYLDENF